MLNLDFNDDNYCGKSMVKYLHLLWVVAVGVMIASYWYLNIYKANQTAQSAVPTGPVVAQSPASPVMPPAMPTQQGVAAGNPVALQGFANTPSMGTLFPEPILQNVAAPVDMMGAPSFLQPQLPQLPAMRSVADAPVLPFPSIVKSMLTSVVNVSTQGPNGSIAAAPAPQPASPLQFAQPFTGVSIQSIGSGVIITEDGYIVTNYHVVEQSKNVFVTVYSDNGSRRLPAQVIRLDEARDLALLKIDSNKPLKTAALGRGEVVNLGDPVITVGCPFGLEQTVSKGVVSAIRKSVVIEGTVHKGLIQTDAAINQGNSGGPLVSNKGTVIGINTAIYSPTRAFSGVGFAVPANHVVDFVEEVIQLPKIQPMNAGLGQMVAAKTQTAPPIPKNAIMPHDDRGACSNCHPILNGGGQQVNFNLPSLALPGFDPQATQPETPTQPVQSPPMQAGKLGQYVAVPPAPNVSPIGVTFSALDKLLAERTKLPFPNGVFVQGVQPGFAGEKGGLAVGDVIFKLDGRWVRTPETIQRRISTQYSPGDELRFSIMRQGQRMDLFVIYPAKSTNPLFQTPAQAGPLVVATPPQRTIMIQQPVTRQTAQRKQTTKAVPAKKPAAPVPTEFEWQGMELVVINKAAIMKNPALKGKKGAEIIELDPGLAADMAGIRNSDIVVSINNMPVNSNVKLDKAINAAKKQQSILFDIDRNGRRMFVTLR
ncbi:MAG: trypsin-like peptidase domain-containing protein [Magnetococcales bacterium]|nr:trypsin-like peptidase domain-containing protein [Magnetococcales bacterium]